MPITFQCVLVHLEVPLSFLGSASRRPMMQWATQNSLAKILPVAASKDELQMPNLIHCVAGAHWPTGMHAEEKKSSILGDCPSGVICGPAVLPRQPLRKREPGPGFIKGECLDPAEQFGLGFSHKVTVRYLASPTTRHVTNRKQ